MGRGAVPAAATAADPALRLDPALRDALAGAAEAEAVAAALDAQLESAASDGEKRAAAARVLRDALDRARSAIEDDFRARRVGGHDTARRLSLLMDFVAREAYRFVAEGLFRPVAPSSSDRLAVAAVGGCGRAEMAPYSDLDLVFITPHRQTGWSESVIEATLYLLWDLKVKVGHATRGLAETVRLASSDLTIKTSLLEMRPLAGDAALVAETEERLWSDVFSRTGPDFVAAKLEERDQRHERQGGSRYLLEPNVKESKGGLRDLHTLFWLSKCLYRTRDLDELVRRGIFTAEEAAQCLAAARVIWSARCGLHYIAGRAQEKLTFDQQFELAELFGYREAAGQMPVERFMKRYFLAAKQVGDLTRIFCSALEHEHKKSPPLLGGLRRLFSGSSVDVQAPFQMQDGRLTLEDLGVFERRPIMILEAMAEGVRRGILLHPRALQAMTRCRRRVDDMRDDPETRALLLELLTASKDPVRVLRRLSEVGVLGRLIPEFGRVIGLMQFNLYHHYTVDEHTILAIETYRRIASGALRDEHPVETDIAQGLPNHRVMTIALLLHDIGKGLPEDHSIVGERIARRLCPELGLAADETETVAWLVREHLTMSDVAQKRDLSDAATIRAFADVVRSPSRLRLLYLFTACDIRAVGPGVWNGWKAQLLRQLYRETYALLTGDSDLMSREERIVEAQSALRAALGDWSDAEFDAHVARMFPTYWTGVSTSTHALHAEMMRAGPPDGVAVRFAPSDTRDATKVAFATSDHPGIFARMTGALAIARASVLDARAYTTKDGLALNTFWVQDENRESFDDPARLAKLAETVEQTLRGEVVAKSALAARRKLRPRERPFDVAPYVVFDNDASDIFTVIETNGRDRVGLLHDLSVALLRENVSIFSAIIATYGEHAVDVFYVKDLFGMKLRQPEKRARVEAALLAALEAPAEATARS